MNEIPPAVTLYWQEERIKELETELAMFHAYYGGSLSLTVERNKLLAENERLRAALEAVVVEHRNGFHEHGSDTTSVARMVKIAREALAK